MSSNQEPGWTVYGVPSGSDADFTIQSDPASPGTAPDVGQMRFGRGLDNRRIKASAYRYRHTTRETIQRLREYQRVEPILRGAPRQPYRYERELEDFLRHSPSVRPGARLLAPEPRNTAPTPAPGAAAAYDDLDARELIALLPSLDADGLRALHEHEAAHQARATVLAAIERLQPWEPGR